MPVERTTLVIGLDALDQLDQHFERLNRDKFFKPIKPAQSWAGDVLLSGYGPKGLYVFVGILRKPTLSGDVLSFEEVERFWHPVVAIYDDAKIWRQDLVGDIRAWSPATHFYAVAGVADRVAREADESLRRQPGGT